MSRIAAGFSLVYAHPSGGRLFQGGEEDAEGAVWAATSSNPDARSFRVHLLVLCAQYQPRTKALDILSAPFYDQPFASREEARRVIGVAGRAAFFVAQRVAARQRVLVCCQAGLNRSGLVSGLALRNLGVGGESAVRKIRRARGPSALGNASFARVVLLDSLHRA